jgi:acetyl/propionyl-CoA carboxylase alpha subunit
MERLLIANRGEIAIRIARAAGELGIRTVGVFSEDDAGALHVRRVDEAQALRGAGPAAYLDVEQLMDVARATGCDALHPGYGFLSESPVLARRATDEALRFVGPRAEVLELFADKLRARGLAERLGVPIVPGTSGPATLDDAREFLRSAGAIVVKAVAGAGGRGMRAVHRAAELDEAYARCQSEARAAFGTAEVYVERLVPRARHVEVQVIGDGTGVVIHLGERECTLQRRHQKLVEVAPSPSIPEALRERLADAAVRLAAAVRYGGVGTFEFLVDGDGFAFIEANPRLQVEHPVTEEVTGVDLVRVQLEVAAGRTLAELGLRQPDVARPRGFALEVRVNAETIDVDGAVRPSAGTLSAFEPPSGPGIRVDTAGTAGAAVSPSFDPLLAKVIVRAPRFPDAVARAARALAEFRIAGVATNVGFLAALLRHPRVAANDVDTRFVEEHGADLARAAGATERATASGAPPGLVAIATPVQGMVVSVDVAEGEAVPVGRQVAVVEAMKMEFVVRADASGIVRRILVAPGDALSDGQPLVFLEPGEVAGAATSEEAAVELEAIRPDLDEARRRHALGLDEARPEAVARRRRTGQRTVRENVADLCDPGSFIEYGALVLAAQRRRRSMDDLLASTPADGLVTGIGAVNGALFDDARARCMVIAYDYTVLAGTQGAMNHKKKDRMLRLAETWRLPVVLFAEGGGGRPGDSDWPSVSGLDTTSFAAFARLSGLVPLVGIVSGRCFAGNAALLGCCDVIIATENATIGMGGPAMIEGGGLGVHAPDDVGPVRVQAPNGVIDVVAADEADAVRVAKRYLAYFQGPVSGWTCGDQRRLRHLVPENRVRVYDVRAVIDALADEGSVLELRRRFGVGMITALVRIEGRPLGVIANDPTHLGGAIDAPAADKAARFLQLCDAFDVPILSLCDTPGFMVGPAAERTALVRHVSRMFLAGASLDVPFLTIVLRKGYGLGAQAMAAGSFHAPLFTVSWPSGEFGGMGLEGAVRLGFRRELAAIADPKEREAVFAKMVASAYEQGKAINVATYLEIDDVIDPAESRGWIVRALRSVPPRPPRTGRKRPCVDAW